MKRNLLRILCVILILAELCLLASFLPQRWQEDIYGRLDKVWPSHSYDYSPIAHPNLNAELRPIEPWGTALLAVLVLTNGGAIVMLWRRLRACKVKAKS